MKKFNIGCCRECLNTLYGLKLEPKNCVYEMYPGICSHCGMPRNVVTRLKKGARVAVAFGFLRSGKKQKPSPTQTAAINIAETNGGNNSFLASIESEDK